MAPNKKRTGSSAPPASDMEDEPPIDGSSGSQSPELGDLVEAGWADPNPDAAPATNPQTSAWQEGQTFAWQAGQPSAWQAGQPGLTYEAEGWAAQGNSVNDSTASGGQSVGENSANMFDEGSQSGFTGEYASSASSASGTHGSDEEPSYGTPATEENFGDQEGAAFTSIPLHAGIGPLVDLPPRSPSPSPSEAYSWCNDEWDNHSNASSGGYYQPHNPEVPVEDASAGDTAPGVVLQCEFAFIDNCPFVYALKDEYGWMHHIEDHMKTKIPNRCLCWFCEASFNAEESGSQRKTNFEDRLHHIAGHYRRGDTGDGAMRDEDLIRYLHRNRVISNETFAWLGIHSKAQHGQESENRERRRHRKQDESNRDGKDKQKKSGSDKKKEGRKK